MKAHRPFDSDDPFRCRPLDLDYNDDPDDIRT